MPEIKQLKFEQVHKLNLMARLDYLHTNNNIIAVVPYEFDKIRLEYIYLICYDYKWQNVDDIPF